ncbi:MAG TPA: hypothetical protein VHN99_09630, partial [Deinococcales bacterium]|nr:hypothetical protein [Deinococcales bacterium]
MNPALSRLRLPPPEAEPRGWAHESYSLHRSWASRRAATFKARAVLVLLALLVPVAILTGWPWAMLLALAGLAYPTRVRNLTLHEIERVYGSAYTTALAAPRDDPFGLAARLNSQARTVVANAELP